MHYTHTEGDRAPTLSALMSAALHDSPITARRILHRCGDVSSIMEQTLRTAPALSIEAVRDAEAFGARGPRNKDDGQLIGGENCLTEGQICNPVALLLTCKDASGS